LCNWRAKLLRFTAQSGLVGKVGWVLTSDALLFDRLEPAITDLATHADPVLALPPQPRAIGVGRVTTKLRDGRTVLDLLHQQGSLRVLFPRTHGTALDAVMLNTGGGITGGDRFQMNASAGAGCHLVLTTQAAERAYRAQPGEIGRVETELHVGAGARLDWLPQETLLFEGSALSRQLRIELAPDARLLMVEPVIFGRAEMGEVLHDLLFRDRVDIVRDGKPKFADRTRALTASAKFISLR